MMAKRTRDTESAKRRRDVKDMVKAFNDNQLSGFLAGRERARRMVTMSVNRGFRGRR